MVRAVSFSKNGLKKGSWSKEEDDKLRVYIQAHGHSNWRRLPKLAGLLRCGKSCRLRWMNYLRPDVKRGNFTEEEEDSIIKLHNELGNKWSLIAKELPGRTDNEIKNQWHTNLKKRAQKILAFSKVNELSGETLQHAASSQVSGVSVAERVAVETSSAPNPLKSESFPMSNSLTFESASVVYGMKNSKTSTESSVTVSSCQSNKQTESVVLSATADASPGIELEKYDQSLQESSITVSSCQINKQTESVVLSATADASPGFELEKYDQLLQETNFWNSPEGIPFPYGKNGDAESSPTSFTGILSGDDFWTQPFVADNAYNQYDYPSSFQEEMYTLWNDFFMDDSVDFICQPM